MRTVDNAHVLQTRLILLDAPLILFMALSFYSYIRFHKLRYRYAASEPHPRSIQLTFRTQRVYEALVDLDAAHWRLLESYHFVQDGRALRLHDSRHGGRYRPLEPPRHQARIDDRASALISRIFA